MLGVICELMGGAFHIEEPVDQLASDNVCVNDILYVVGLDLDIGGVVWHNPDDGTFGAEAETSGCYHIYPAAQIMLTDNFDEVVDDLETARAIACRTATTQNLNVIVTRQTIGGRIVMRIGG